LFSPRPRAGTPPHPTIAVLQFDNLSDIAENEYFCFGLTDEITTELAKTGGLRVVARTSAASFKRGDDIASISRRLKADAVLEGSVRMSSGRVLVSAQVNNAADSTHLWSEMYDRPGIELISVQDEIAQAITRGVRQQLTGSAGSSTRGVRYSRDAGANLLYWKGSYLRTPMGRTNWRNDLLKSADYLEQAVRRDDRFAPAYAALADVYVSLAWERGGGPTTRDFMTRGERAAERAVALDDTLAEAHGALGTVQFFYNYDPASSEKSFQRALQSDPSNGKARMWYAYALVMQRRFDEAVSQARQAKELDPLSYVATTHLAVVNYFSRRYDEALRLVRETLEVAETAPAHGLRGMILETQQRYDQAIAEYQAGLRLVPTHSYIKGMLGHAYAMSGREEEARKLLNDARLEFEQGGLSDLKVSYVCLALGEQDRALQHLERDYDQRDPELPYINADPVFDPVRNHPRFAALVGKMGLSR
jgi:serine/threonine-protein kinase